MQLKSSKDDTNLKLKKHPTLLNENQTTKPFFHKYKGKYMQKHLNSEDFVQIIVIFSRRLILNKIINSTWDNFFHKNTADFIKNSAKQKNNILVGIYLSIICAFQFPSYIYIITSFLLKYAFSKQTCF